MIPRPASVASRPLFEWTTGFQGCGHRGPAENAKHSRTGNPEEVQPMGFSKHLTLAVVLGSVLTAGLPGQPT